MKASWVNGLRSTVVLALLSGATPSHAQTPPGSGTPTTSTPLQVSTSEKNAKVVAVRVVTEDGRVLSESPPNVLVQPGKPLDPSGVAESLRALYRSGDYADVRATTVAVPGGVRVDFVVRVQLFFNQVLIQGLIEPPSEASAVAAVQLPLGQPFRTDTLNDGLERLRETLREEGLYQAELIPETRPHPETQQIDVIIHVKPGPRARVREVRVKNETEYADVEFVRRLKMKPGREVTSGRVQHGTERIRKFLVGKGHLNARAIVHRGEYDPKTNTIPLELEVTEGPLVKIVVAGAKFSKKDLRKLIPVYEEGAVDPDLLEEGKRNIHERLERAGYFDAEVDYTTATREVQRSNGTKGTEEVITYRVERGKQHKLLAIEITGNRYFSTELLRSRMQIYAAAFGARGRFSRRLLEADRVSLRNLYLANGFLQVNVDAQVFDNYEGKQGDLVIRFVIQEGPQTRVASLTIEGIHAFTEADLLGVIGATPGQPYSESSVATDRVNVLALYYNEGFPEARFTAKAEPVDGGADNKTGQPRRANVVRLIYHIDEGPQTRVRNILLTGYDHTRPGVIRREVQVRRNAPLRQGEVVDSQRRLYNLGVFNRVTIEPQNPKGTDPEKDVVVLVEEAKRYTIAYGGGVEAQRLASTTNPTGSALQVSPRGILEISKLNLTGRADSLSLKLRGSTIQNRALLAYSDPNTFGKRYFSFQATAYTEKTQDINTFTLTRYESAVQLAHQHSLATSLLYRYSFRKVRVSNLNIPEVEVPLFNAPTLVSQFGLTWARDTRNNPAEATKGNFNSFDVGIADTAIGSSASFWRGFFQNSTYHPIKRRFSFARSTRIGVLAPYRDTVSLTFPAPTVQPLPRVIPLPERFFAGGGTSLRGFALNQAGPRDAITGFPVGGQALLIFNQEVRFPLRFPFVGTSLGGAIFYDGGNVYSRLDRVTFRTSPLEPIFDPANPDRCLYNCSNELNYFAHTIGIGFRYATPVGPIRIDIGYQLNRPKFVTPNCPTAAPTCIAGADISQKFKATRLPGLQIFFNLGSSF
jgi:outer membrane protein assembly complex protein YaeT